MTFPRDSARWPPTNDRAARTVGLEQIDEFDTLVDVRSESEFAHDHIPGAINCPVLNDAQRAEVGTIYKQVSAFDAKKLGAALVSDNIARHLRERFHDKPRGWRPLVYCWRGGGRSGALAHVLSKVGWATGRLDGGYKAYRREVLADLDVLPARFDWHVVCGMTGTGKSRLLAALQAEGAQVLDLEALAAHRGSVLGNLPGKPQPPQKLFESRVWHALRRFHATQPVFVESESKKIGTLRVPDALIAAMWAGKPLVLEAPLPVREALLKEDYAHFLQDCESMAVQLECLANLHGRAIIQQWKVMARAGQWSELIEALLVRHYDPAYVRAIHRHYPTLPQARVVTAHSHTDATYRAIASTLLHTPPTHG